MNQVILKTTRFLFIFSVMLSNNLWSQSPANTKISSTVKKGDLAYKEGRYLLAEAYYKQYMKQVPLTNVPADVWFKLADSQWLSKEFEDCRRTYETLSQYQSVQLGKKDRIRISTLYARTGQYSLASKWLKGIPGYEKKAEAYENDYQRNIMYQDSDSWVIRPLGATRGYRVFAPTLVGNTLFFSSSQTGDFDGKSEKWNTLYKIAVQPTSPDGEIVTTDAKRVAVHKNKITRRRLANVYEGSDVGVQSRARYAYFGREYIEGKDTAQSEGSSNMDAERNQSMAVSFDKDDDIYFSANDAKNNVVRLMQGHFNGTKTDNISTINMQNWDYGEEVLHPAINKEGTLLIFSSNRGGDGYDLYYCIRETKNQPWGEPHNLFVANTIGNEIFPSITDDGYLYFSSDNLPGLGGLDIYRIKLADALNNRGEIEHLGYPINSSSDDYGWTQYPDGLSGYFTTDRDQAVDNIYSFRYIPKAVISGQVKNKITNKPVGKASVFVYDKHAKRVHVLKTDTYGRYSFKIQKGHDAVLRAVINPYDTIIQNQVANEYSNCLSIPNVTENKFNRDLLLNELKIGTSWTMNTIFYDFDKWDIKTTAYPVLDSVVVLLKEYPLLHIEIASFADRRGSDDYNLKLSQQRANSVLKYIAQKGIDEERIRAKGYGKTNLINMASENTPQSEEFHQINRRTEMRIVGLGKHRTINNSRTSDLTRFSEGSILEISSFPNGFFEEQNKITETSRVTKKNKISTLYPKSNPEKKNEDNTAISKNTNSLSSNSAGPSAPKTNRSMIIKENGEYVIQAGAFSSSENAKKAIAKLESFLPATLHCLLIESDTSFFKVRVGYFRNYKDAESVADMIDSKME